MSKSVPVRTLPTRVGHADWGDNQFRGHSVNRELAGRSDLWNIISLAVDGPRLDPQAVQTLDDLCACALAADPRIWPLKLTRLGAAYGHAPVGLCTGILGIHQAPVGGQPVQDVATLLTQIAEQQGHGTTLTEVLEQLRTRFTRIPGFGVPLREEDERVVAWHKCVARRGHGDGRYSQLVGQLSELLSKTRALPPNFGAVIASTLLDVGFRAEQTGLMAIYVLLPNYFANAYEGAKQQPEVLRRLPPTAIEYVGPPPRMSPRQQAATPKTPDRDRE